MEQVTNWLDVFMNSTQYALGSVFAFLPKLLGAIIIFLIGWLVAKLFEKLFNKIFGLIGVNKLSQKSGVENFLGSAGFERDLSWIFARIIFWGIILIFLLPVADILGFVFFANIVNQAITFLPNIIIALLIVLFGTWGAKVLSGMVRGGAVRLGAEYAEVLGTVVSVTILVVTFIVALSQLNIDATILGNILLIIVAALAVGLAIAFGFGAKDITKNIIAGAYLSKVVKPGSLVKTANLEGKVVEIGSVTSTVEVNDKKIQIANSALLESI